MDNNNLRKMYRKCRKFNNKMTQFRQFKYEGDYKIMVRCLS